MKTTKPASPKNYLKDIRRKTRRIFTVEQKTLIVMEVLRQRPPSQSSARRHDIQEQP